MKSSYLSRRLPGQTKSHRAGLFAAAMLALAVPVSQAVDYTWNLGNNGGNWAVPGDWNPTAPATGPATGDTANLNDVTTGTRIVVYDTGATGALDTLTFTQTDAAVNELQLAKSLTLANALSYGATGGGTALIDLQNLTLTAPSVTINSGGSLLIGLTGAANSSSGSFIIGNTTLSGGTIATNSAVGTGNGTITATNTGSFTMTGGVLNLTQSSTGGVRFAVTTGVNITGGTINYTGTNTTNGGINEFYMSGTTNNVLGNAANPVTLTTPSSNTGTGATGNGAGITLNNNGAESLSYNLTAGSAAFDLHNRATNATGTVVHTLTYSGASAAGPIGTLYLNQTFGSGGTSSATNTLRLASNLTTVAASTSTLVLARDPQATSTGVLNLDLNGNTLNGSAVTSALALTNVTAGTDSWSLTSSSGTTGTLQASAFNFAAGTNANLRLTVGPNAVLQATGTATNNFTVTTPTTGTSSTALNANSTFLYTGTAATLTAGTTSLGRLTVGDGTNTSVLTANSATTNTQGAVTINNAATLALGTNALANTAATTGFVTINSGGSLNASALTQTLANQVNAASGSASAPAFLNVTAAQTLASTIDLSALPNVSLGGNNTLTATAGQITPANSNFKLGSPLGTFNITGAVLSGTGNSVEVTTGTVRVTGSNGSYGGATVIDSGGRLIATTNTRIPSTTALTVNGGGTFDLVNTDGGTTQTVVSLAGAGTVTNTSVPGGTTNPAKILTVNGAATTAFSGTLTEGGSGGTLALTRGGTGTLTLSGTNNYTGGTNITGGTLLINSANTGGGAVALSGGALGGSSSLAGALTMTGGTITGGTVGGVGMLTLTSNAALNAGTYQADVSGTTIDRLIVSNGGTLALGGVTLTINGTLDGSTTYDIANYGNGLETGTFAADNLPANYTISYGATEIDLVPVPEPSTWVGCVLLIAGVSWQYRRRRAGAAA